MNQIEYDIDARSYLSRAIGIFNGFPHDRRATRLVYAALELRCCIERLLFEYLLLVGRRPTSRQLEKLYRAKDLAVAIRRLEPRFDKKIEYLNLIFEAESIPARMILPDLPLLNKYYGKLGSYLHAPKRLEKSVGSDGWWMVLINTVTEASTYLGTVLESPVGAFHPNEIGNELLDAWINGALSDKEVIERYRHERSKNVVEVSTDESPDRDDVLANEFSDALTGRSVPLYLYKYRDWCDENHRRMLTHGEFYFASAPELNDPFELVIPVRFDLLSEQEIRELKMWMVREKNPRLNDEWVEKTVDGNEWPGMSDIGSPKAVERHTEKLRELIRTRVGICSFMIFADNLLAWAHYADAHKGFCVGINREKLFKHLWDSGNHSDKGIMVLPVKYYDDFPTLKPNRGPESSLLAKIITTKSGEWAYEDEVRIFDVDKGGYVRVFPKTVIEQVIIGSEMCRTNREEIAEEVRTNLPHVELYEAQKREEDGFGLLLKKLDQKSD